MSGIVEPLHYIPDPAALMGLAARARQEASPALDVAAGAEFVAARLEGSAPEIAAAVTEAVQRFRATQCAPFVDLAAALESASTELKRPRTSQS